MLLPVAQRKCDEDTAIPCLSVSSSRSHFPGLFQHQDVINTANQTSVICDSPLPSTQHTQPCANPAAGFIGPFQNSGFLCHAYYPSFHFSLGYHAPLPSSWQSLAMRHHFLPTVSKKQHLTFLRSYVPTNPESLPSSRLSHFTSSSLTPAVPDHR